MGVPALFRWLSRKYPKIVARVIEDMPSKVRNGDDEVVEVPLRYESQNPNGFEVDNLYLDMNGIVHPCTHPEGKPAPETEEEMMVEIFKYTERVVNMARPRKVLMMAIDGVAPRAKMNQQRSRRFRAAQEAADKEEERREAIKMFEAMGHPVSEETRNQKSWDTNAITPGTPFMDLLSNSLKYWISYKLTNDPGWKDLKVIISDSSVPGEGEHKIVDWIRRQRSYPDWDPNTSHVMYGLDADLIMLSLATHEPHFRVLREDVFFQGSKGPQSCKNCGQEGHLAVNCKSDKLMKDPNIVEKAKPVDPKPFIFLDVSILREYLAVELNVPGVPFPFDLELAIDDWIFMIFFVGNDFLPHLPSLEIREGAIDALLKIWRAELPRMGGYLTNHGKVNMGRAQIILEGLAKGEDEIFQRRKEDEDRQGEREKRRRIDDHRRQDLAAEAKQNGSADPGSMQLNGTEYVQVTPSSTARGGPLHPSLPSRPQFDIVPKDDAGGRSKRMTADQREAAALKAGPDAIAAMQGSNVEAVNNRKAVRQANMSAAEKLKAELEGTLDDSPVEAEETVTVERTEDEEKEEMKAEDAKEVLEGQGEGEGVNEEMVAPQAIANGEDGTTEVDRPGDEPEPEAMDEDEPQKDDSSPLSRSRSSRKRKAQEVEQEDDRSDIEAPPDEEANQAISKKKLKVNPDGTVEGYEDDVRLWEPGYRERYYEKKFGVPLTDTEFLSQITRSYMEGLCWVLEYYYQGVPAWDWFYPYHYAPFAQDFQDVGKLNITFEPAAPFTPFAQLLGVFPAASRIHLPEPLQPLMTDEDSPIIDFYPDDFDIDMNGKKMAWQGVALLPFIDQHRLLAALKSKEDQLTPDEQRRNRWGENRMFVAEQNALFDVLCKLYTLKAGSSPMPIDARLSQGMSGQVLADPLIVPNSALDSPLPNIAECPDLETNASLAVRYYFPRQKHSHRSVILRGYLPGPAVLSESDKDWTRRGGPGPDRRGGGGGGRGRGRGRGGYSNGNSGPGMSHSSYGGPRGESYPAMREGPRFPVGAAPYAPPPVPAGGPGYGGYGGGAGGYGGYGYGSSAPYAAAPPPPAASYRGGRDGEYRAPPPQPSYGSYAPPPPSRNPYAPPPPAPYGAPAPSYGGSYGSYDGGGGYPAPPSAPPSVGHGGYGGGGTYGGQGGGYNPYDSRAPPPRRY